MIKQLNDSLDDLLGGPAGEVRTTPVRAPADYQPRSFDEVCAKCRGTGQTRWGRCFRCEGAGKRSFKTSPEARAKNRQTSQHRRAAVPANNWEAFVARHPEIAQWIDSAPQFGFAVAMRAAVERWGSLTDNQLAGCRRALEGRVRATQARAERATAVDTAGVDRLKTAFDKAIAFSRAKGRNLRQPRITIGSIVISPAGETSKNPGAIYVKSHGDYLGKIMDGRFFPVSACTPEQQDRVLAFIADPKAAAEAYGIETGTCCICNATLTNKESIERGIGPICAEKFGW